MKGLPIIESCKGCGACCRHMRTPPFVVFFIDGQYKPMGDNETAMEDYEYAVGMPAEARRLIELHQQDWVPEEYPCAWLNEQTGECRYYEHRPIVCRDFEVGGEDCRATREFYGITV